MTKESSYWVNKGKTEHQKVLCILECLKLELCCGTICIQTPTFIIHAASLYYLTYITNVWGCSYLHIVVQDLLRLIITGVLRIISCVFFLKELFVRANRKRIFTGNYVTRGKIERQFQIKVPGFRGRALTP